MNTKYRQAFTNLTQGTNVFTIPPNNGIQDIVCNLVLPAITGTGYGGIALNPGWGYSAIKQISWRYGGSPQYFMTGQQVLEAVLSQAADSGSRDALLQLGGLALSGTNSSSGNDFANVNYAYIWLPLPHVVPTAEGKPPPFPSDLLT